ncbi:probable protein phosphatase 2C 35 isoform X1 [Punica granatum]|uniref:protein-serine/threonine phosphatase n=2 Tax=Punica granatum TaxID=22663 RepID=A0A6P8DUK8_PUNGR|nr:probable protein phosphatase 2C 35 isoform X1 [Punica granatum]
MGCAHGKCCGRYPKSSNEGSGEFHEVGPFGKHVLTERSIECVPVPSHNFRLEYSVLTQRGYYPDSPDKENQDSFCIKTQLRGNANVHFFGVFDGHGQFGTQCANFVRDRLVEALLEEPSLLDDPVKAYNSAFLRTNQELHESGIDDSMSGTTAITVLVVEDKIFVANVGDSRAVIAVQAGDKVLAEDLSCDQTPFRRDEYERVKACGARVLSVDQVEGLKDPDIQSWGDEESQGNDPPRLWVQNGMYPGTAFTRSIGDSIAEKIGVVADPEVSVFQLRSDHLFFVVASDGVFEFLSSQAVVNMVASYSDPRDACAAIAGESYKLWLENENRTDDITIIIAHIKDLSHAGADSIDGMSRVSVKPTILRAAKGSKGSSVTSGSEIFRSIRSSDGSDLHSCQCSISMNRSPAIVVPSPTHHQTLQMDGG